MPSKEEKQAWLIVHSSIAGAIFGIGIKYLYDNFSWRLLIIDFIVLWLIFYLLRFSIKFNR